MLCRRPLVAVFLGQRYIRKLKMQQGYFKANQLVKANRLAGTTLYFFSVDSVNFGNSKVRGIYFDHDKRIWVEKDFPLPDVLYDRVKGVKTHKMTGDDVRRRFDRLGIKKINSRHYFDKWELYRLFQSDDRLRHHVPETMYYKNPDDLIAMLEKYQKVYLKGCRGSRGKQVVRVAQLPEGGYEARMLGSKVLVENIRELHRHVMPYLGGSHVIIQQAIDLITLDQRIVDFRGELQRNGMGELTITAVPVRVGKQFSPISTRGASYSFEHFFSEIMKQSKEETSLLKSRVEDFLVRIYVFLERSNGPFGELGIDIGMDKAGKLWFIESNTKSTKVSLCNASPGETMEKAFLNPLEYAKYLYREGAASVPGRNAGLPSHRVAGAQENRQPLIHDAAR